MATGYENISVVMPVRNGEYFLEEILNKILKMVQVDDEIIVINDGSTDATGKILQELVSQYSQIKLLTTSGVGLVAALNLGIESADNNWIARFDVDDDYPLNRLAVQRKLIAEDVGAIFCDYSLNVEGKKEIGIIPSALYPEAVSVSLIHSQRTPHPGVILNRSKFLQVGGYREIDFPAEDISLWLRLSQISKLVGSPQKLLHYRLSKNSVTGTNRALTIKKTNEVLSSFRINENDIKYCQKNWKTIFYQYNLFSHSSERKLLFLYDLRGALKFQNIQSREIANILFNLIVDWATYPAALKLFRLKFLKNR